MSASTFGYVVPLSPTISYSSLSPVLTHPVIIFLLQNIVTTCTLSTTTPSSSLRKGILTLMILGTWRALPTILPRVGRVPWAAFIAGYMILSVFQYVELVLLRKWTFENQGQAVLSSDLKEKPQKQQTKTHHESKQHDRAISWKQFYLGYFVTTSSRHIRTPFEAKGVPKLSSSQPSYLPSRSLFVLKRACIALLSYFVLDIITHAQRTQHVQNNAVYRPSSSIPILARLFMGEVSRSELGLRLADAMGYYVFCYCLIQCYTSVFACAVVTLGIDDVKSWKPNFGSLSDGWSLRQFWG